MLRGGEVFQVRTKNAAAIVKQRKRIRPYAPLLNQPLWKKE